jgi:hypothetical protein
VFALLVCGGPAVNDEGRQEVTTVKLFLTSERPSALSAAWTQVSAVRPRSASAVAHATVVGSPAVRIRTCPDQTSFPQVESVQSPVPVVQDMAGIAGTYGTNGIAELNDVRGVPPRGRPV